MTYNPDGSMRIGTRTVRTQDDQGRQTSLVTYDMKTGRETHRLEWEFEN